MSKHPDFMSGKSENCTILDTKKVEFLDTRNRNFLDKSGKLQKTRKSQKSAKISKICKISKNQQNRENLENLENFDFLAIWRVPYGSGKIAIRRSIWPLWRTCPEGQICHPETKILDIPETKKIAKISKFWPPKKIENLSWLPWRSIVAPRGRNRSPEGKKSSKFRLFGG